MSTTNDQLKSLVKEKYGQIAATGEGDGCCGSGCGCGVIDEVQMAESYSTLNGYVADADLGLGCGLPTEFAQIREGNTVVDLGSGAGNDAFIARSVVGPLGKVIGVDFTEPMIARARSNAEKLNYNNVEFRHGDIENIPVHDNSVDVVVSNCVFNLVPDKVRAFEETFRILKVGGHFSISDIVLRGELPEGLRKSAEMYAGCVAGAIDKHEYLSVIKKAGFENVIVQKEKKITLPDSVLSQFLKEDQIVQYRTGEIGIFSITVFGEKNSEKKEPCCGPGCCN